MSGLEIILIIFLGMSALGFLILFPIGSILAVSHRLCTAHSMIRALVTLITTIIMKTTEKGDICY